MGIRAAAVVEEEAAGALFPLDAATLQDSSGHSSAAPKTGMQASDARGASLHGDGTTASSLFADDAAASAPAFAGAAASLWASGTISRRRSKLESWKLDKARAAGSWRSLTREAAPSGSLGFIEQELQLESASGCHGKPAGVKIEVGESPRVSMSAGRPLPLVIRWDLKTFCLIY